MGGGERAGVRTQDLMIKSHLLYRLSYTLPQRGRYTAGLARHINKPHVPVNPQIAQIVGEIESMRYAAMSHGKVFICFAVNSRE